MLLMLLNSEELRTRLFLPAFDFPLAVPNLSLLQASEQLFSCLTAYTCKVLLEALHTNI